MSYDFQSAVAAAKAVVESQENKESSNYKYPLLYPPQNNTIVVRPLFNPASGQIVRLVNRHEKVPCYRTYGIECPICKVQQQVKDVTGQDPFGRTKASRSRGLSFAQFISSTSPIDKGGNRGNFQPGDIILFMYPWSVYQQINTMIQAIAQTPTGMEQAFSHAASGLYIQINVDNNFKYTTTQVPYLTFPTQQTDDDFFKMLDGMESINEQVIPSSITEEVDKQVKEYSDAIYRQYIAPRTATQGVPAGTAPVNYGTAAPMNPQFAQTAPAPTAVPNYTTPIPTVDPTMVPPVAPVMPAPAAAPATTTTPPPSGQPACMGKHVQGSPQCVCCPAEVECINCSTPF